MAISEVICAQKIFIFPLLRSALAKGALMPSPIPNPYRRYVRIDPSAPPIKANIGIVRRALPKFLKNTIGWTSFPTMS